MFGGLKCRTMEIRRITKGVRAGYEQYMPGGYLRRRPIHPMLTQIVQTALSVCDRAGFVARGVCQLCGGTLSGYDTRTKRFALLCDDEGVRPGEVALHRAYCHECGRIMMPEVPFYEGTRIGSPVVDLSHTLCASLSSGNAAALLGMMGVKVDRWSVCAYSCQPIPPPLTIAAFGMHIPFSIISLSGLAGQRHESDHIFGDDILAACNYPSQKRAPP